MLHEITCNLFDNFINLKNEDITYINHCTFVITNTLRL